jgi:hypothetical protein
VVLLIAVGVLLWKVRIIHSVCGVVLRIANTYCYAQHHTINNMYYTNIPQKNTYCYQQHHTTDTMYYTNLPQKNTYCYPQHDTCDVVDSSRCSSVECSYNT